MQQQLKNIVFDFGGVLIDWNPVYLYDKVFTDRAEMDFFLWHICSPEWNMQQDAGRPLAEATTWLQKRYPKYHDEIGMFYGRWEEMLGDEIEENTRLVKPLSEKYKVYGLTNWSAETIPVAYERYSFFDDLHGIVVSGEEKIAKPDPRLFRILLNRYGMKAEESVFIDDNATNIVAANNLGFRTIHLAPDVNLEEALKAKGIL